MRLCITMCALFIFRIGPTSPAGPEAHTLERASARACQRPAPQRARLLRCWRPACLSSLCGRARACSPVFGDSSPDVTASADVRHDSLAERSKAVAPGAIP